MSWALFDLNGTLLDPRAIGEALPVADGEALALAALDDAVMQAMADTLSGEVRAFPDFLEAALRRRLEIEGEGGADLGRAMQVARQLPPFDGAAAALDLLADAGVLLGVLTNSAAESAREALTAAELADRFEVVLGADAVGAYKPDRRVYEYALGQIDAAPGDACLVAAHGWDILGASRAGLRTGWISRKERALLATVPEPDHRSETLEGIARAIVTSESRDTG